MISVFTATKNTTDKNQPDAFVINSHVISASVRPPEALIKSEGVKYGGYKNNTKNVNPKATPIRSKYFF